MLAATHCLHKGLPPGVFEPVEVLALYLSALGHDAGHFRLNNAFLKNSKHALYKKYRESVLENFHLGLLFELLEDEDVGIVQFLPEQDKAHFRDLVTTLILATDMAKHMGLFKQLQAFLADARARHRETTWMHESMRSDGSRRDGDDDRSDDEGSNDESSPRERSPATTPRTSANVDAAEARISADLRSPDRSSRDGEGGRAHESWVRPTIDGADAEQRVLVMQLLLKCADLGNVVRPLEIADAWGKRIMEEFYQQGEKELTLGLPLTTFPNRKNFDYIFARHQNGFLVNVVRPLFDVFTALCDFDTRESVIAAAAENGDAWMRRENAYRPREKGLGDANVSKPNAERKDANVGNVGGVARKPGALARQSTMGWVQEFKQSNLTMLTANAMEMKGLHLTLDFAYGADDECASAVRSLVPYVSRGELARLGREGMLEADPEEADPEDAESSASFAAKLAATETFDAAVVVATFDGFLDLERRVAAEAEAEAKEASKKEANRKEAMEKQSEKSRRAAAAFGAALSGMLAKAVDSVHASGGDVVRMGHDGIVCVFPLSGGGATGARRKDGLSVRRNDGDAETSASTSASRSSSPGAKAKTVSESAAAALRAARCAFTLVSQLSSAVPELSPVGAPDGGATRAHLWPGLRAFSRGTRVMVVESLQLSRMGLGRLLDHFGCMTHFAENASQAAAACANMEFDVILMNVLLPVKNGYELSRHIRAHGGPVNGRAYIAAVTYVQQPELLDQCVAAGMNEVIVKPATMSSLRLMFRRAKRRAREMMMRDAMRQHSFSSADSLGNAASRQNSEGGRSSGTRAASRRDKEVVANPYSLSAPRSKKPAKRKSVTGSTLSLAQRSETALADDDALAPDDGGGAAVSAGVRLSIGSDRLPSLVVTDLTRGANEKCVPVHLPRFSDMLISASAGPQARRRARFTQKQSRVVDDGVVGASTSPGKAGKRTGPMARFWRALCGFDDGSLSDARADERAALHERSTLFASGARLPAGLGSRASRRASSDDGSGTADSASSAAGAGFEKAGVSLARYKASGAASASPLALNPADAPEADPKEEPESDDEQDLYDADDATLDATSPLPVTIAVSAAVGFGRVATMRVGTSCGGALEGVRREADASAPWDTLDGAREGSGGTLPELAEPPPGGAVDSAASTPERQKSASSSKRAASETRHARRVSCPVRRAMLSADRDVVVAADAPIPGAPPRDACEAAAAAAAGGPGEGGPFQQAATLIRVATAGDVALSPTAWRLVRENCEGDTPPILRGGARLNRIRVHEVVPPLTNHPLAPRELAATVPSSPDPRRALAALASLVPRPIRAALAERAPAAAAALARRRDRWDAGYAESDESATEDPGADGDVNENENESESENERNGALRRLPMPHVAPHASDAVSAVVYLPGPSRGAGRTRGEARAFAQTVASATAACVGLLQRFPHGSLTRVGSDVLFDRDVDKRTGGGGGGGDGVVLHCDFSPPLPRAAGAGGERRMAGLRPEASNEFDASLSAEMSLSERRAAAAAAATAFALAARAAMAHLGHAGASVGVASGRAVSMAAGAAERRCEWTVTGDVVSRAERLAAFADAEVLCDLLVVKQCASSGIIDFDPVPHAAGNDVVCARNLSAGHLDRIVGAAGGARMTKSVGVDFGDFASSSPLGRLELTERGAVAGDGIAPGPCVLMPQGTRENFGDASAKRKALVTREARLESEARGEAKERGGAAGPSEGPGNPGNLPEGFSGADAPELEVKEGAGRLSYGALAALSLASASLATEQTLRALRDPGKLPAPPPLVAHETTLLAAKRVIAEAQEAMAPRLLFLEGPARAGKTRAAAAVLDLPEARRMWLLRTRGAHAVDEAVRWDPRAGGGASITSSGSFALASFQRLFHQLLGFSPDATSRERKAAVVALLEGCGEERERLGRYAKPILEILGIERADEGAEFFGDSEEDALGSDRWSSLRSGGSGGANGANSKRDASRDASKSGAAVPGAGTGEERTRAKGSLRGERSVARRGLSLDPELAPGADGALESDPAARRKPSRQASRLGLARDRSEASQMGGGEKGEPSPSRRREGLGGFLDSVSAAAMEDATRHLCPDAMDALLGDGVDIDHDGHEGPEGDGDGDGRRENPDADDEAEFRNFDAPDAEESARRKMARAVVTGRLTGAVAFTRQRNGVQRRDHNKRFRAVMHRRKNTLESIMVSTHGAARLCKTMALMLERLLLGRATQAAPAQPSLPGWILLVEDAQWLDPFSMGLIRALLERCSIPLVVVMTHVSGRETSKPETRGERPLVPSRDARADEAMHDVDESARGGFAFATTTRAGTDARVGAKALQARGAPAKKGDAYEQRVATTDGSDASEAEGSDVWGAGVGLSTTRVEAMDTKRWLQRDLDWMLELYSTTVVDVAPLSRSDLRVFVEECASRALRGAGRAAASNEDSAASEDSSEVDTSTTSERESGEASSEAAPSATSPVRAAAADSIFETRERATAAKEASSVDRASTDATRGGPRTPSRDGGRGGSAARAVRRAGGGARSVGLPSAVHAELYKNTGGDPLHAASLANLLVSCGAVSVIQKGVGGVPEVVVKAESDPGGDSGLSSASVARMHARDAMMESLERALSPDAFSALKTLAASGGRVRCAQAHALTARRLATREKEKLEKRDSMSSAFRREFTSNLAAGIDDQWLFALCPKDAAARDDGGGSETSSLSVSAEDAKHRETRAERNERVADPRAVALAYGAARCSSRASAAIVELVKAGVLVVDWGALEDARAAAEAAWAEAAVAFAVADVPFPLAGLRADALADPRANESGSNAPDASGAFDPLETLPAADAKPSRDSDKSLSSRLSSRRSLRAEPSPSPSRRGSSRPGTGARAWSGMGAARLVPWLVFANDDVRAYAYESQAAWRRRAVHLDATRALRDEAQYCVGDDVAATALVFELAAKHLAQAQMVDRAALAAYNANAVVASVPDGSPDAEAERGGEASIVARASGSKDPKVRGGSSARLTPQAFDGPSAATAAAVVAKRALGARALAGGLGSNAWSDQDRISPREILLAASGLWQRVRFHEAVTAAHMRRGTVRAAILSASALSLAAAAWAEVSKEMRRVFGKRQPRLVEQVTLANEDGKNLFVRNAAWSLTISRLLADLGDVAPPFLTAESALARDRRSPLHHARRAFLSVDVKWPFDAVLASTSADGAETKAAKEAIDALPSTFLRIRLADGAADDAFSRENGSENGKSGDDGNGKPSAFAACFGGAGAGAGAGGARERAVPGAHGLDAALRRAVRSLFANVDPDPDKTHARDHRLAETGRGSVAGATQPVPWEVPAKKLDGHGHAVASASATSPRDPPKQDPPKDHPSQDPKETRAGTHSTHSRPSSLSPLCDMRAGVGDALQYAAQVFPRASRADRKFAQAEMAFAAAEHVALAAAFAGRPAFAAAAVVRLAKCFAAAPAPAPTDAATLLCLAATAAPEGEARELALRRAEEILDADAREHARRARGAFAEAEKTRGSLSTLAATASRKAADDSTVRVSDRERRDRRSLGVFAKRALGGKRVQFHETPPSPRAGAALCARAMALCARGDWFAARAAAAAAAALLEKPGASDLRLCDVARCLGAAADAHLGRWESASASTKALAHDRESHGELGPWVLALSLATKTAAQEYEDAARRWRDALGRVPFSAVPLGAAAYADASRAEKRAPSGGRGNKRGNTRSGPGGSGGQSGSAETSATARSIDTIVEDEPVRQPARRGGGANARGGGASSRDFPAYVCCRAFAAQALWSAGERAEAIVMLEQVCGDQLPRLRAPAHCLLPAAALAAGETVARACRVGAFEKKAGRRLLAETHACLERAAAVMPFAEELAARLREIAPVGYL